MAFADLPALHLLKFWDYGCTLPFPAKDVRFHTKKSMSVALSESPLGSFSWTDRAAHVTVQVSQLHVPSLEPRRKNMVSLSTSERLGILFAVTQ